MAAHRPITSICAGSPSPLRWLGFGAAVGGRHRLRLCRSGRRAPGVLGGDQPRLPMLFVVLAAAALALLWLTRFVQRRPEPTGSPARTSRISRRDRPEKTAAVDSGELSTSGLASVACRHCGASLPPRPGFARAAAPRGRLTDADQRALRQMAAGQRGQAEQLLDQFQDHLRIEGFAQIIRSAGGVRAADDVGPLCSGEKHHGHFG